MPDQTKEQIRPGSILLAEPFLKEPAFCRAAILICHLDDDGALGLVLNKPIEKLYQIKANHPLAKVPLFSGGPVDPDHLFYLHHKENIPEAIFLKDGIHWQGDLEQVADGADQGKEVRFFLGYAGWDAGQLENEIKEDTWLIYNGPINEVLKVEPEQLWKKLLQDMGPYFRMVSNFPLDPNLN